MLIWFEIIDRFIDGEITDVQCQHCLSATNLGKQYVIIVLSLFADAHRLQEKPEKCLSETGRASCADRRGSAAGGMSAGERQH